MRRAFLVALLLACGGCFAARLPAALPEAAPGPVLPLRVGVAVVEETPEFPDSDERAAAAIADDLAATGLFEHVEVLSEASEAPDLTVSLLERKGPDRDSWCYESLPYTVFTLFIVPGCGRDLGYRLRIEPGDGRPAQEFDFAYDELIVSGWVALFLLPSRSWQLPSSDRSRAVEYLREQLRPFLVEHFEVGPQVEVPRP